MCTPRPAPFLCPLDTSCIVTSGACTEHDSCSHSTKPLHEREKASVLHLLCSIYHADPTWQGNMYFRNYSFGPVPYAAHWFSWHLWLAPRLALCGIASTFRIPELLTVCVTILCKCCNYFSYYTNTEVKLWKPGSVCCKLVTFELNPYQGSMWIRNN